MMNFLKSKEKWKKPFSQRISKRVSMVSTQDLINWVDPSLQDVGRAMITYERTGEKTDLEDALLSAEVLHAILDTIKSRKFG